MDARWYVCNDYRMEVYLHASDHCIDSIRQSLICSSDISTNHYNWVQDSKHIQPHLDSVHTCRNFEKIREWAFDRYVDLRNNHLHVENGQVVDYTSLVAKPNAKSSGPHPIDFHHTREEFLST